jgi:hypothetical protein
LWAVPLLRPVPRLNFWPMLKQRGILCCE